MREIAVRNNNERCLLRFQFEGRSYSLTLGSYEDRIDRAKATEIAAKIRVDCLSGQFDATLAKYKPVSSPTARQLAAKAITEVARQPFDLLTCWRRFTEAQEPAQRLYTAHYKPIHRMLEKYQQPIRLADIPKLVASMNLQLSSRTTGDRLCYLRKCLTWAIQHGYLPVNTVNPLIGVKPARVAAKPKPKPFTKDELSQIIAAFENHPTHSHYADFVKFLIATGVRPSEAIGLRWKHIDFSRNEIQIYESLARGDDGSTSQRLRKGTKTNNLRVLPLSGKLRAVLHRRFEAAVNKQADSLVFTTLTGKVIDDDNFRDRAWKVILIECGIEYRSPYNLRHSLLSHMIEDGVPLTGVAYIAGHSDTTMVQRIYGHMVNRPELPDLL